MKLAPPPATTRSATSPTLDRELMAMVRETPADPTIVSRSGFNADNDLGRSMAAALSDAAHEEALPTAKDIPSAEAERRQHLIDVARIQRSAMPIVAGGASLSGLLWGSAAALGTLAVHSWFKSKSQGGSHHD